MARLPRPHIPFSIRLVVITRQLNDVGIKVPGRKYLQTLIDYVACLIVLRFGEARAELHHRPALINRVRKGADYEPSANDPSHLFYLVKGDHDIETRVRGQHGAYSDLALNRKNKNIAKNRDPHRRKTKIAQRPDFKWPSRPFNMKPKPAKRRNYR